MSFANDCLEGGYTSLRDIPSVDTDQCTVGTVEMQLRNPRTGEPVDLTQYGIYTGSSSSCNLDGVKVVLKEMPYDRNKWAETCALVINAELGEIEIEYDEEVTRRAGIFTAEAQVWSDERMRKVFPLFFIVNPSLESDISLNQTLSIAEIRMTMRDTDPEGNYLIDALEFSQQEIALCIRRCIDYWNEAPPPVAYYKATNFPWRYHLSLGVVAELYFMSMHGKMRNELPATAGGVSYQLDIKWKNYQVLATEMQKRWERWVRDKKYEINVMGTFQTLGGYYSTGYYR